MLVIEYPGYCHNMNLHGGYIKRDHMVAQKDILCISNVKSKYAKTSSMTQVSTAHINVIDDVLAYFDFKTKKMSFWATVRPTVYTILQSQCLTFSVHVPSLYILPEDSERPLHHCPLPQPGRLHNIHVHIHILYIHKTHIYTFTCHCITT